MTAGCALVLPQSLRDRLGAHLFPGDGDEHGAVITAGVARSERGLRLLGRDLLLAEDGVDYVAGQRGYRMLRADFIRRAVMDCRDRGLCYLAVHNHGGDLSVGFSPDDMASHEHGYPALLDIANGQPVGALVVARNAVAGDVWLADEQRLDVAETRVIGPAIERIYPQPPSHRQVAAPRTTARRASSGIVDRTSSVEPKWASSVRAESGRWSSSNFRVSGSGGSSSPIPRRST